MEPETQKFNIDDYYFTGDGNFVKKDGNGHREHYRRTNNYEAPEPESITEQNQPVEIYTDWAHFTIIGKTVVESEVFRKPSL
jgi:hypothetical protein